MSSDNSNKLLWWAEAIITNVNSLSPVIRIESDASLYFIYKVDNSLSYVVAQFVNQAFRKISPGMTSKDEDTVRCALDLTENITVPMFDYKEAEIGRIHFFCFPPTENSTVSDGGAIANILEITSPSDALVFAQAVAESLVFGQGCCWYNNTEVTIEQLIRRLELNQ